MAWLQYRQGDGRKERWREVLKSGILLLLIAAMTAGITGCSKGNHDSDPAAAGITSSSPAITPSAPQTADTTETASASPVQSTAVPVDYSVPVPQSPPVDETYFSDAVFIGDSRTQGFLMYSGITTTQSLANVGLTVSSFFSDSFITVNGQVYTASDALKAMSFSKVYIMLGINELGWVDGDAFKDYYGEIIDTARSVNPNAIIYVQSILPVSKEKSDGSDIYNMANVDKFNGYVKETAIAKQAYYVNVAEAFLGADGCLPPDASSDGVHLNPDACGSWLNYLENHTVKTK